MNEHGWPGWPDDPTGGDAYDDGGLHDAHDLAPHEAADAVPGHGWSDHAWAAGDTWDDDAHHGSPGGANDDGGDHDVGDHDGGEHRHGEGGGDDGDRDATGAAYDDRADHGTSGMDHSMGPVGTDPDAVADHADADPAGPFPPVVDVGALPEPVDGFPWIDTGSLGLVGAETAGDPVPPVTSEQLGADLAAYAATDLPPGVDPWAELATSDDPATSALARWWAPGR